MSESPPLLEEIPGRTESAVSTSVIYGYKYTPNCTYIVIPINRQKPPKMAVFVYFNDFKCVSRSILPNFMFFRDGF